HPVAFSKLLDAELGVKLSKGYTVTDWESRPINKKLIEYALNDVIFLKKLTDQLIDKVKLDYQTDIPGKVFDLTRGHPALVQQVCHGLVSTANNGNRRQLGPADLESVLENHIYVPDNPTMDAFWNQFCKSPSVKATVRQIIAGETPGDFRAGFTLSQYGYTIKGGNGMKIRVPIFENWIEKFGKLPG
ncbi:MAG: hypothetical protein GY765_34825, partial [bacterium]|nr:hypothetical protein [bacterium]